jgi:mRNA-degrading endonuclease RelE of RelBE toxin-antitoxin system
MNPIDKFLQKLPERERIWAQETIEKLVSGKTEGLDVKKLRGREDIFRVRKGDIRIIYMKKHERVIVLFVGRRNDRTYNS